MKASPPAKPAISPAEIRENQRQFDALSLRLDSARQSAKETGARLQELHDRQRKAEKLLSLTEGIVGFASERQRASDVIEECAEHRARWELRAQGGAALIKQLETELGRIDTRVFQRAKEIEQLAHDLSPKEV